MAKIELSLPTSFKFSTEIDILIQHINRADHLANENLVALLNEARTRYTATLKTDHLNFSFKEFINADLAVIYKAEAHYGDRLRIEVTADDFNKYGCDFVYRVTLANSGKIIALAKTSMLRFDYKNNKLQTVPDDFSTLF